MKMAVQLISAGLSKQESSRVVFVVTETAVAGGMLSWVATDTPLLKKELRKQWQIVLSKAKQWK